MQSSTLAKVQMQEVQNMYVCLELILKIQLKPFVQICEDLSKLVGVSGTASSYDIYDLFDDNSHLGLLLPSEQLCLYVNPSGSVRIVKAVPHQN